MLIANRYVTLYNRTADTPIDYTKEPFTITCLQGSLDLYFAKMRFAYSGSPVPTYAINVDLVYSLNGGDWNAMPVYENWTSPGSEVFKIKQGDVLKIKAGPSGNTSFNIQYNTPMGEISCGLFGANYSDPKLSLSGNIMTLLDADTPPDSIQSTRCFSRIGPGIICPEPVESTSDFDHGFVYDISNLKLPATTLANGCYAVMFAYNTGLTSVPLGVLTKADNLEDYCYRQMFLGCSSLNTIYCEWDPTVFSSNYTEEWLNGVASTGTFYCNEAMKTYLESGSVTRNSNTVPSGWTIELLP